MHGVLVEKTIPRVVYRFVAFLPILLKAVVLVLDDLFGLWIVYRGISASFYAKGVKIGKKRCYLGKLCRFYPILLQPT
jgi:hypothetical protein